MDETKFILGNLYELNKNEEAYVTALFCRSKKVKKLALDFAKEEKLDIKKLNKIADKLAI